MCWQMQGVCCFRSAQQVGDGRADDMMALAQELSCRWLQVTDSATGAWLRRRRRAEKSAKRRRRGGEDFIVFQKWRVE